MEGGFEVPELQIRIADSEGRVIARVDLYFRKQRVVVEVDGKGKYADPDALWREKRREDALRRMGIEVVRLTWADLMGGAGAVRALVLEAFARSAARG